MNADITIDAAGRIVIPKVLRDELHLAPGDTLKLESTGDRITLQPAQKNQQMIKKAGLWVLQSDSSSSVDDVNEILQQIRDERMNDLLDPQ